MTLATGKYFPLLKDKNLEVGGLGLALKQIAPEAHTCVIHITAVA